MRMFRSSYESKVGGDSSCAASRVAWHRVVGLPAGRRSTIEVLVSRHMVRMVCAVLAVLAFSAAPALAAFPEVPKTEAPLPIAGTTATLKGELNPGLSVEKVTYHFAYSAGPGATCTENGLTAPVEPFPEAAGNHEKVTATVTGLEGSTEYAVCLIAANPAEPAESTQGTSVSFKTLAEKPKVESEGASPPTPFDATLEGQVNPENQETTYHLEYATNEAFTVNVKTLAFGGVDSGVSANQPVGPVDLGGGLTPNTTYYYRVLAKNPTGEAKGTAEHPVGEFKTLPAEKPVVEGEKLVGAALTSDTIEAQLNPKYQGVGCEVQYVTKTAFEKEAIKFTENVQAVGCSPVAPATEFGAGGLPVPFTATLGEMKENAAYEYRVVATNNTGTLDGAPQALTRTPPQITVGTVVEALTRHTALIAPASITPEVPAPVTATYYILYGTSQADEQASTSVSAGSGLTPNAVAPVELYGLQPGTTYHYALVAYNGNAKTTSPEATFTTAPPEPLTEPPTVGTQAAQFVNEGSAVIEAELNPQGQETSYEVQYGASTAYGSSTPGPTPLAPYTSAQGTIIALTGLAPGTTYHYRLAATNAAGTGYGPDATFTTAGAAHTTVFTSFTIPPVPLIAVTPATFPTEAPGAKSTPKALTNKQKLAAALKACRKDKNKGKRATCQKQAHRKYGALKKK
jgi:hypothetical protein